MTIPNKRKLFWVSEDIEDEEVIQERKERAQLVRSIARDYAYLRDDRDSRDRYYSQLRGRGLSVAQASLAAMPVTKKGKKIQGIGAKYRAKKKAANYGATPAFNKALVAAVKKVENRSLETYFTNFGITFNSQVAQATGTYSVGGFQAASGATANTNANVFGNYKNVHVLSLPAQIQNGVSAGYRKGQNVTPIGFRLWIRGFWQNMTVSHDIHVVVARWKGGTPPQLGVYPALVDMSTLGLYEAGAFGPNASSYLAGSANMEFSSGSRWDRDQWDIKKKMTFTVTPLANQELGNTNGIYRKIVSQDMYYKFPDKIWDYQTSTGNTLKGGDYFLMTWNSFQEPASAPNGGSPIVFMQYNMELSFKDA